MRYILQALGWLLGWVVIGLTTLIQMGLRLLYWLLAFIAFFLFVFLVIFMLLGQLSPFLPKLAVIWGVGFQFAAAFIVLLVVDLGMSLLQGAAIACMSYRKQ